MPEPPLASGAPPTYDPRMMVERDLIDVIDTIRERDARYRRESYLFVMAALDHVVRRLVRPRHVTGQELLQGIVSLAKDQFGPPRSPLLAISCAPSDAGRWRKCFPTPRSPTVCSLGARISPERSRISRAGSTSATSSSPSSDREFLDPARRIPAPLHPARARRRGLHAGLRRGQRALARAHLALHASAVRRRRPRRCRRLRRSPPCTGLPSCRRLSCPGSPAPAHTRASRASRSRCSSPSSSRTSSITCSRPRPATS